MSKFERWKLQFVIFCVFTFLIFCAPFRTFSLAPLFFSFENISNHVFDMKKFEANADNEKFTIFCQKLHNIFILTLKSVASNMFKHFSKHLRIFESVTKCFVHHCEKNAKTRHDWGTIWSNYPAANQRSLGSQNRDQIRYPFSGRGLSDCTVSQSCL